jgi:hypothetical protein
MSTVPPGGPSTINGVLYQMLWTLLRTMKIHARDYLTDARSGEIVGTTLVLEPQGGGGDLQETGKSGRTVQQLKARSGGGTWSLREVVEGVLPDLYLAVDLEQPNTCYSFITEGRIDGWRDIYESFFRSLESRTPLADDVRSRLDDSKPLRVGKRKSGKRKSDTDPFWSNEEYTELHIFDRIVSEIRKRKAILEIESVETTQRKLWHLLSRFSVLENQTMRSLKCQIDRRLYELIDYIEDLDKARDALLMSLAVLGSKGSANIDDARAFLAAQGMRSRPFSDWSDLRRLSHEVVERTLSRLGYVPDEDVRREAARAIAAEWPVEKPLLLLSGGSGQGKSWCVCALARELMSDPGLIVLVEGARGVEAAVREAARIVWRDIKGHDQELSLDRIAVRLKKSHPERAVRWLSLLIDGLTDPSDARELARQSWAELGIRLVVSCEPDVAASIMKATPGRHAAPVTVDDFTLDELQTYLTISVGPDWPRIPGVVRDTLLRPLLARLYREVAVNEPWKYTNEYALYGRFWARLDEDELASKPLVKMALERLALSLLNDAPYPWTARQLEESRMDNEAISALLKAGWLRRAPHDRFEVWHDRLLNWAVATSLVNALRARALDLDSFCNRLIESFGDERRFGGRRLGYVAMDVLWLLTHSTDEAGELIDAAILALEGGNYHLRETLYKRLLPTLGPPVLPSLFRRLPPVALTDDTLHEALVVHAITAIDSDVSASSAAKLLRHESPRVQRSAMRILSRRPFAAALDRLWALHVEMESGPERFLRQNEHEYYLHRDSFGALRSCVKLDPLWIERAIERAETSSEPRLVHDLAYLLGNIESGSDIWRRCKPRLFRLVPPLHDRSLIANIFVHGDRDEIGWLVERVSSDVNLAGPWALKALAKLAPDLAVQQLPRLPIHELGPTKHWYVPELLAKRPEATRTQLLSMMRVAEDPWNIAFVFNDDEDSLDEEMLDVLLSDFEKRLTSDLSAPRTKESSPVYRPLLLLSRINRLELLEHLERSRGTPLEEKLTEWMLREGPQTNEWARPVHDKGIKLLQKLGGMGFTRVVNAYLKASTRWGRFLAMDLAFRRPDAETIGLLRSVSQQEELWDDYILEQTHALEALAYLGFWHDAVRGVMRWGLALRLQLTQAFLSRAPLDEAALRPAIDEVSAEGVPSPGSVFVLGLSSWCSSTERVRSLLASAPFDSDMAHACMITLGLCQDDSPDAVSLIASQLGIEKYRYQAKIALLRIGSHAAIDALLEDLRNQFDLSVAIDLYQRTDSKERALEIIKNHLATLSAYHREDVLEHLLELSDDLVAPFLDDVGVRDFLRERSFADEGFGWRTNSKSVAIHYLARFDSARAAFAALKVLENPEAHDREHYPYLVVELAGERAVEMLVEQAVAEKSTSVIWAIARALDESDHGSVLAAMLTSSDPARRLAGCRLAEKMRVLGSVLAMLEALTEDPDDTMLTAAWRALKFQRAAKNADTLLHAILNEQDPSRRWILIDAFLAVADPGDSHRPFPRWVSEAFGRSPSLEQDYVIEKLKERRKKLEEEAKKRDEK